jgi:hypothetical protein
MTGASKRAVTVDERYASKVVEILNMQAPAFMEGGTPQTWRDSAPRSDAAKLGPTPRAPAGATGAQPANSGGCALVHETVGIDCRLVRVG